ncbi:MAG: hypothetical protein R3F59_20460 [Myxococcota bacterium]
MFAPFLHASFAHRHEHDPFVLLGGILMLRDRRDFWTVSVIGAPARASAPGCSAARARSTWACRGCCSPTSAS